ncbi:hypothetical protein E4U17_000931 [Claviceps sp. LM77 group G4]|nr:hypothetical protein E4U17_000931 [Claviceps sp. LM77 group G4]KAG6065943.1 hypothetical protein E4U16_000348 [Claviceps sp. LM84 group G4]
MKLEKSNRILPFDAGDHGSTTRPSMLVAYGICKLENQLNSYDLTAILESGSYSAKSAILTSTINSIATFRQLFYNLAATLRKVAILLRQLTQ